jgi:hypothetical protein
MKVKSFLLIAVMTFFIAAQAQDKTPKAKVLPGNGQVTVIWENLEVSSIDVAREDFSIAQSIANPSSPLVITGLTDGLLYRLKLIQVEPVVNATASLAFPTGSWTTTYHESWNKLWAPDYDADCFGKIGEVQTSTDGPHTYSADEGYRKVTFLPDGEGYTYHEISGLPDLNNSFKWKLNGNELDFIYDEVEEDVDAFTVLSRSETAFTVELHELHGEDSQPDYDELYVKTSSAKVTPSVNLYCVPGEVSAARNVEISPVNGGLKATYDAPSTASDYAYFLIIDGKWYNLSGTTAWGVVQDNTVLGMTTGQAYKTQFATVRYAASQDGSKLPVISYSDVQSVTVSNEKVSEANVWSHGNALYINAPAPAVLSVYTLYGALQIRQSVSAGKTAVNLPRGLYIVKVGNASNKVFIR